MKIDRRKETPCMYCGERTAECHAACEKYKAFRDEREQERKQRLMDLEAQNLTPSRERGIRLKLMQQKNGRNR